MATFTLSRKSLAAKWQVLADGQPVLSFREGLLAYTKEVQNKELEAEALAWLADEYDSCLTDCYIDARRHLLWSINSEWKWQILVAALRYGISIDDEDDALAHLEGRLDKEDKQHYLVYTVENYDIEQLELDGDIDKSELIADLDFMTVDEMDELQSILYSFDINRSDYEQSMPDSVLVDFVALDWARDLLWWPAFLDDVSPRQMMGNTISHIRKSSDMTQEELADAAGITVANVRNIEAGKYNVNIDILSNIANALGADLVITGETEE